MEGLDYRQEKAPYIKSVSDPGFEISPPENKSWKAEFPLSEVRQKIQNWTGHDPGAIDQVKILEKGPSGRATKIKLGNVTLSGPSLRLALGSEVMRSTLLSRLEVQGRLMKPGIRPRVRMSSEQGTGRAGAKCREVYNISGCKIQRWD